MKRKLMVPLPSNTIGSKRRKKQKKNLKKNKIEKLLNIPFSI